MNSQRYGQVDKERRPNKRKKSGGVADSTNYQFSSFSETNAGAPLEASQRMFSTNDNEEGMPQTEDAHIQLNINFNVSKVPGHNQQLSGQFGGFHSSNVSVTPSDQYPSFRGAPSQLMSFQENDGRVPSQSAKPGDGRSRSGSTNRLSG